MKAVLVDHMGDDLKVVNAARASFGQKATVLDDKGKNLIRYLARGCPASEMEAIIASLIPSEKPLLGNPFDIEHIRQILNDYRSKATHWVPFAHCQMTFEVSMPIFVARQLIRHTVGVSISEMSRRYVSEDPEYWFPAPDEWRLKADNVKQGSSAECVTSGQNYIDTAVRDFCSRATELYRFLVDTKKVAPELARMVLPINAYTDWTWTISLVTAARVCHQRLDSHAQKEIQVLAQQVHDAAMEKYPVSFKALMDYGTE